MNISEAVHIIDSSNSQKQDPLTQYRKDKESKMLIKKPKVFNMYTEIYEKFIKFIL